MTDHPSSGLGVVTLRPARSTGGLRMRAATVLVLVLESPAGVRIRGQESELVAGDVVVIPAGQVWSLDAVGGRVVVAAAPAGPERVVAALSGEPLPDARGRVQLAADLGVEIVLSPHRSRRLAE